ncbi:Dipeptidyl peptidase 1-like 2 [Homarus americanus]|uniref:Dipeptidyl peptidase 1 n=1 Tax=Homarus americanus TaxID=6706 RepID=A0A8J5JVI7_HOMAM|nr:Dipeptidyl peptidase 1-like 2 [Homarus americanus]
MALLTQAPCAILHEDGFLFGHQLLSDLNNEGDNGTPPHPNLASMTHKTSHSFLSKSTWRKIQELGLSTQYNVNVEFRLFCGMLDALAFLPLEDVIEGMRYLKTVIPPEAEELLMYFDRTYVSGSFQQPVAMPSDALMPLRMRHTSSMFAPHLWNVHDSIMNNNARTNNICEGWNNKLFNLVGHYYPSIWRAIEWFQLEEATVSTIIKQDAVGNPPQGRVRQRYMLAIFLLVTGGAATLALAHTPGSCMYEEILGTWIFRETERTGDHTLDCQELGTIVHTKTFTLNFPDTATDELGNRGSWTMIANQGFEVNINERSYFAFSYYESDGNTTISYCDRTMTGWSRDTTVRNWSCFRGHKTSKVNINERSYFAFSYYESDGNTTISYCDRTMTGWSRDTTVRNWSCFRGHKTSKVAPRVREIQVLMSADERYKNDHHLVAKINAAQTSWTAKVYPEFEKYTVEEMYRRGGGVRPIATHTRPFPAPTTPRQKVVIASLPENFDWRNASGVNYISEVRDQGSCGSCYAFASMANLEAQVRITTRNRRQDVFSTQIRIFGRDAYYVSVHTG